MHILNTIIWVSKYPIFLRILTMKMNKPRYYLIIIILVALSLTFFIDAMFLDKKNEMLMDSLEKYKELNEACDEAFKIQVDSIAYLNKEIELFLEKIEK